MICLCVSVCITFLSLLKCKLGFTTTNTLMVIWIILYCGQDRCKQHFVEEDRDLLPLMEAVELSKEQQKRVVEQCLDVMQGTHSYLFNFLLEGLLPREAMQYLDLITSCGDKEQTASVLRLTVD
jgi:hypothetical protein